MRLQLYCLLFLLLLSAAPCLSAPLSLAINPLATAETPKGLATEYLKKLVEERSGGRIQVKIVNASNADSEEVLKAINDQQIQMALLKTQSLNDSLPILQLFDLPFLFRDRRHLQQVIDGETGREILQKAQTSNLKTLAAWDGAARQLLTSGKLEESDALLSDIDSGQGWQESTLSEASRLAEQRNLGVLNLTDHRFSVSVLLTHQAFWKGLPEDLKIITTGAIKDATRYIRELVEQADLEDLKKLQTETNLNIQTVPVEQRTKWQASMTDNKRRSLGRETTVFIDMITGQVNN